MSLFGSSKGEIDDQALVQAVRKRLLRELQAKHEAASVNNVINNHTGGSLGGGNGGGGLMEAMNGGGPEDPFEYLVDIEKRDIPGEEGGKPLGWTKRVHRHREKKGLAGK